MITGRLAPIASATESLQILYTVWATLADRDNVVNGQMFVRPTSKAARVQGKHIRTPIWHMYIAMHPGPPGMRILASSVQVLRDRVIPFLILGALSHVSAPAFHVFLAVNSLRIVWVHYPALPLIILAALLALPKYTKRHPGMIVKLRQWLSVPASNTNPIHVAPLYKTPPRMW